MRAKNWQSNRQTDYIKQQSLGGIMLMILFFIRQIRVNRITITKSNLCATLVSLMCLFFV